jgi:hypothetical protein
MHQRVHCRTPAQVLVMNFRASESSAAPLYPIQSVLVFLTSGLRQTTDQIVGSASQISVRLSTVNSPRPHVPKVQLVPVTTAAV